MKKDEDKDLIDNLVKKINSFSADSVSKEDIIDLIDKISSMHRNKKFGYFSEEDIQSQVVLICLQQIIYYEPEKAVGTSSINSLERWLNRVVKNRLANYYRDNYSSVNEKHKKTRLNLNNCLDISQFNFDEDKFEKPNPTYQLELDEYKKFIEDRLTDDLKEIYNACLDDENVSSYYKSKLGNEIAKINEEWEEVNKNGKEIN